MKRGASQSAVVPFAFFSRALSCFLISSSRRGVPRRLTHSCVCLCRRAGLLAVPLLGGPWALVRAPRALPSRMKKTQFRKAHITINVWLKMWF
jgi:hypothetical protein